MSIIHTGQPLGKPTAFIAYDRDSFEKQRTIKCGKCKYQFGDRLLDGKSTYEEFGGCPKCFQKKKQKDLQ
jgi:hypothetical protein